MAKHNEALDAVRDERPFAGVHILATALLCAAGASDDELELARRLLENDPKRDAPREAESVAGAFNRHMDAAIDSVNASAGAATRAGRRATLAADLDRAGLVLVDRNYLAGLLADRINLVHAAALPTFDEEEDEPEELGAELDEGEAAELVERINSNPNLHPISSATVLGLEYGASEGVTFLEHTPSFDVAAIGDPDIDRMDGGSGELDPIEIDGHYLNPSVND